MKRLVLLGGLLLTVGCEANPIRTVKSGNPDPLVTVKVMAEFDGIRLYQVDTGDRVVYVAATVGTVTAQWTVQQGKSSYQERSVTVEKP